MSKIAVLCNDRVEEIECLAPVDFCRRAGIEVVMVSVTGNKFVMGSHGVPFGTDVMMSDVDFDEFDGLIVPGGPGTGALGEIPGVKELAVKFYESGRMLAAICAAPGMISSTGIMKDRVATGFPGCKPEGMAKWTENTVERDGNLITAKGAGAASYFAMEIIRYLEGAQAAADIQASIQMPV